MLKRYTAKDPGKVGSSYLIRENWFNLIFLQSVVNDQVSKSVSEASHDPAT